MDTKKLRQKILDLAIRGKLVPQDPNDEPASVLLERIRAEKEQLIKEGKIKRSKKSAATDKSHYENVPFEIPGNWCWTTIDDVNLYNSSSIEPNKSPYKDFELYSVPTFESGMPEFVKGSEISSAKKIVAQGDVLLCKINPHLNRAWIVTHYDRNRDCIASSEWIICRNNNIEPRFLAYCFTSPYFMELMLSNVSGVGGSLMRAQPASVGKYIFPLPPIKEQIRIVVELDKWLMMIDELDIEKQDLFLYIKQIKSKILDLAISGELVPQDPNDEPAIELLKRINPSFEPCDNSHYGNLPQGWTVCKIKDIFNITMGQSPTGESINGVKGIEFHQGKIHFTESYLSQSGVYTDQPTKIAEVDSLLLCVRAPVGVLNITQRKICIGRGLCALKPKYEIDNLYWLFILTAYKDYFESNATGSTFKAISGDTIKNAVIKLPPLQEQKRILSSIISLYESLDAITAEL